MWQNKEIIMVAKQIIIMIGKIYSLDILEALLNGPKRFSDLSKACPIEKTRSQRLKELKSNNLIETIAKEKARRNFVYYQLTKKGDKIVRRLKCLEDI